VLLAGELLCQIVGVVVAFLGKAETTLGDRSVPQAVVEAVGEFRDAFLLV
jgi:hypothetical protein